MPSKRISKSRSPKRRSYKKSSRKSSKKTSKRRSYKKSSRKSSKKSSKRRSQKRTTFSPSMTKSEMIKFAKKYNIDISDSDLKNSIYLKIAEAFNQSNITSLSMLGQSQLVQSQFVQPRLVQINQILQNTLNRTFQPRISTPYPRRIIHDTGFEDEKSLHDSNFFGISYRSEPLRRFIINEISKILGNNNNVRYISHGRWGIVYDIGDNVVMKVEISDQNRSLLQKEIEYYDAKFVHYKRSIEEVKQNPPYMIAHGNKPMYKDDKLMQLTYITLPKYGNPIGNVRTGNKPKTPLELNVIFNMLFLNIHFNVHGLRYVYNDINEKNILYFSDDQIIDDDHPLILVDYGLSTKQNLKKSRKDNCGKKGSLMYTSLEMTKEGCPTFSDDLESLIYLIWSLYEPLPWDDEKTENGVYNSKLRNSLNMYNNPSSDMYWSHQILKYLRTIPFGNRASTSTIVSMYSQTYKDLISSGKDNFTIDSRHDSRHESRNDSRNDSRM